MLQSCLEKLRAARYGFFTTRFHAGLIRGLTISGQFLEGATLVDETILRTVAKGDTSYMPELLRLKGGILLAAPERRIEDAEAYFTQSLELSRAQGSRAWELRTATDLAALWAGQAAEVDVRRRWLGEQGRRGLRFSFDVLPERHGALEVAYEPSVGESLWRLPA